MNKERKEELYEVIDYLDEANDRLQEIIEEEQESFDNLPEGIQSSRVGESIERAIMILEEFSVDIDKLGVRIKEYIKPKKKG